MQAWQKVMEAFCWVYHYRYLHAVSKKTDNSTVRLSPLDYGCSLYLPLPLLFTSYHIEVTETGL